MTLQDVVEFAQEKVKEYIKIVDPEYQDYEIFNHRCSSAIKTRLSLPSGVEIQHISISDGDQDSDNEPPCLKLYFYLDEVKHFEFSTLYSQAYELHSKFPTLRYGAEIEYEPDQFLSDNFDPRAFTELRISRSANSFTEESYLKRREFENAWLSIERRPHVDPNILTTGLLSYSFTQIWSPIMREIVRLTGGIFHLQADKENYAELKKKMRLGWQKELLSTLSGKFFFKERGMNVVEKTAAKMVAAMFGGKAKLSRRIYEKDLSLEEIEFLEQQMGITFENYVRTEVRIPFKPSEDPQGTRNTLKEIVRKLNNKNLLGTTPGELRITREQARKYLLEDLEAIQANSTEWNVTGLKKLMTINASNLEEFFTHSNEEEIKEIKFNTSSLEEVLQELERIQIPKALRLEIKKKLRHRYEAEKEKKNKLIFQYPLLYLFEKVQTYLTFDELCYIEIMTLQQFWKKNPEELLTSYLELYRDAHSQPLKIRLKVGTELTADQKELLEFPHPFIINFSGKITQFNFHEGKPGTYNNYLEFLRYNDERNRILMAINLENPCLLPLQEKFLQLMGIEVK